MDDRRDVGVIWDLGHGGCAGWNRRSHRTL